jgi:hypothetical protein
MSDPNFILLHVASPPESAAGVALDLDGHRLLVFAPKS